MNGWHYRNVVNVDKTAAFVRQGRPAGTVAMSALLLAGVGAAPAAFADTASNSLRTRIAENNGSSAAAGRLVSDAAAGPLPQQAPQAQAIAAQPDSSAVQTVARAQLIDYRIGWQTGRLTMGLGLSAIAADENPADAALAGRSGPWRTTAVGSFGGSAAGIGLAYRWTDRARVTFDSRSPLGAADLVPRVRVGVEFKSAPSQVLGFARGTLFRMQLTGSSQLQLGLRHGELGLMLRSQF